MRNGAGKRGARFIGYKGTLEFDFRTSLITIYHHHDKLVEKHEFSQDDDGHFGGDYTLRDNFINVMKGIEVSHSPLCEGILSAKMCLCAKKSATDHVFVDIE